MSISMEGSSRIDRGIALMTNVKLSKYIDDPHQKFYYTFNFDRPFDFHVELLNIILDEAKGVIYPAVIKSVGDAPKQFINVVVAPSTATENDDFDFLNEMALNEEDTEDLSDVSDSLVDDTPIKKADPEDEDDEFGGGFDDEEEEYGMDDHLSNDDDY